MRASLSAVVLACLAILACRRDAPPEDGGKVVRIAIREPSSLDPAFINSRHDASIVTGLLEGLFVAAPGNGEPVNGILESWSCSDDGLTCAFLLKDDLRWSDGQPLTARDLAYAWRRVVDPDLGSPGAHSMYLVRGMKECVERKPGCGEGLRVLDERRLELDLVEPSPILPYILAHPRFAPVPRHRVEALGSAWSQPENFVGNGPYLPAEWRKNVALILRRNPRREGAWPDRVEFRFAAGEETAMRWFQAGEVEVVDGLVPLERVQELKKQHPEAVGIAPAATVFYLMPNLAKGPLVDRQLRRALAQAMDRELLVRGVLGTGQVASSSIVPTAVAQASGYRPPPCPGWDPAAARKLMKGVGELPPLEIMYNESVTVGRIMTFLHQNLATELGLTASLRSMEWPSYLETLRSGEFQLARFGLTGEPDPMDYVGAFRSDGPNNLGRFSSTELDDLVDAARREADPKQRNRLLARGEAILCREAAVLPVYHSVAVLLAGPRVKGYLANMSGLHPLRHLELGD